MSEDQAAFARRNEPDEASAIASEADEAPIGQTPAPQDPPAAATAQPDDASSGEQPPSFFTEPGESSPILAALLAADGQGFLRGLTGATAHALSEEAGDDGALGLVLARLGQALAEAHDVEFAFQDLVDALDRRRLGESPLRPVTAIIGAFVARTAGGWLQPDQFPPTPAEADELLHAAEELSAAALAAGGARSWRRLPDIAATIGERAARRGLSPTALATALPRLAARFGLAAHDASERAAVIASTGHPRGALPRGEAAEEPRRMVISGPVEIVILDR